MKICKTFNKGFIGGLETLNISSDFGKVRKHEGGFRLHHGIDFKIPTGTALKAPFDGRIVIKKKQNGGAGLYISLRHIVSPGYFIDVYFMHLLSVPDNINRGTMVRQGEVIATSGGAVGHPNSGSSSGPHLHLEVRENGTTSANAVDPKYWLLAQHTLKKGGKLVYNGDETFKEFDTSAFKPATRFKYSSAVDHVDFSATEKTTPKKRKPKPQNTIAGERFAPGIWQITKLLMDSSIRDKQVLDSGISTQQGSLLNFFRKVCQEPLVELMGDTFGNQYYWIVRRPPFDKEGFEKMIELTTIDIDPKDIVSTDLTWNNQGIYSWYQYVPRADLLGIREANLFVPAVFFPEFASVWGSKPLCIESNYYNFAFSGKNNKSKSENSQNANNIIRNAVKDFKYIVESNAYNPFTRRGTITIMGDRRIKRGTLIQHISGEIFYVDAVSNSFDINLGGVSRTTTLQVSKGMFPEYIYGKEIDGELYSYFNIVEFGEENIDEMTHKNWTDYISKWKVNQNVFTYFMSKQQVFDRQIEESNDPMIKHNLIRNQ